MSRNVLAWFRLLLALCGGACLGAAHLEGLGSAEATVPLLLAVVPLLVLLLLFRSDQIDSQSSSEADSPPELEASASVAAQIAWWQDKLEYLRKTCDPSLPDPADALVGCSMAAEEHDEDSVVVVVLRGPTAAAELRAYRNLLATDFDRLVFESELLDSDRGNFRSGSESMTGGWYDWQIQRIRLSANKGRSVEAVVESNPGSLPGIGVLACILLELGDIPGDGLQADMPGLQYRDFPGEPWAYAPYVSFDPGTKVLVVEAAETDTVPDTSWLVPVFA